MRRLTLIGVALLLVALVFGCSQDQPTQVDVTDDSEPTPLLQAFSNPEYGVAASTRTYEVTIENLTVDNGGGAAQVFSPPVLATHHPVVRMFRVGTEASAELEAIAEDGDNSGMLALLDGAGRVHESFAAAGPIPPGQSATYTIATVSNARRLSLVFMLVNTNDGFAGLDRAILPVGGETTFMLNAYDAGTEVNTELEAHIPGPCCGTPGAGDDEHGVIHAHPGITGDGDLDPATWGWTGPVARVTVRRLAPAWEVALTNNTEDRGDGAAQVFSPPLLVTHRKSAKVWNAGGYASPGLEELAEDGGTATLAGELSGSKHVFAIETGAGPVGPGGTDTYTIEGTFSYRWLSMAFMLVNTNDGFSGVDRLALPFGGRVGYYLNSYDAGTEVNDELVSSIPGPCCSGPGAGTDEHKRIRHHPGISGDGDLDPAKWGWEDPSAMLTVTRVR